MKRTLPEDLEEALDLLIKSSKETDLEEFKKLAENKAVCVCVTHFGCAMGVRNSWGLWKKNKLTSYFNHLGIFHADDMSSIIFTSLHRRLNNKPLRLRKQIKYYKNYWIKQGFKGGRPE